ncbi:MAG: hypothetical protein A2X28_06100 [Elusimicrobia bacterium GWA2_56_46]|nr:MAG: hypothetical protein A2X28_06100 [Elusimicrobia bacterium GWA2_56_46]OGR54604.1 MAG: hypothetical protein A2X39_02150 [Elusimicrobia bacterium GWC2_56_31]HBB67638.1 hypothetical protein [Elusimicrobiota bacterium]HBW23914.1 hypothetical protein [Elusimicrobiota bacterium]
MQIQAGKYVFLSVLLPVFHGGLTAAGLPAEKSTAAVSGFEIISVKAAGPLLIPGRSSSPVVGQGGNYSAPLGYGRTLWFLNNVWTGELKDTGEVSLWGIVDGAVAVLEATSPYSAAGAFSYTVDENKWPLPVSPADFSEYSSVRKFWPRAGLKAGAGYYFYYSLMNNFGPGAYEYFRVGQGLAASEKPSGPYKLLRSGGRRAFWNDTEPAFGSALWADNDGWLYVYGRYATEPGKYAAALARVKPEKLAEPSAYYYYSLDPAPGVWTRDVSEVSPVLENMPEEFSVAYNDYLREYLALYFDQEAGEVSVRSAQYPWGPWGPRKSALSCGKEEYCFGAKEQPAFSAEGGKRIFFTLEKKNMPYFYELTLK